MRVIIARVVVVIPLLFILAKLGTNEAPKYVEAGQTYKSWIAISKFFDLTHEQAEHLFSNDEYQEAKFIKREALKRIRELLNTI